MDVCKKHTSGQVTEQDLNFRIPDSEVMLFDR